MRSYFVGALLVVAVIAPARASSGAAAGALFSEGNRLYQEERYTEALDAYRRVLSLGYGSPELFLNLGNAAYRIREPGWAIYYYEQARRRAPRDPDIQSNLSLARRVSLGDDPELQHSALLVWMAGLRDGITLGGAMRAGVVLVWVAVALLLLSWRRAWQARAPALRWTALAAILIAFLLVGTKVAQGSLASKAVVVQAVAAHTEPVETSTVEFRLPPGSPVNLGRKATGWREIIVSSSLRGWVKEDAVAAFDPPR